MAQKMTSLKQIRATVCPSNLLVQMGMLMLLSGSSSTVLAMPSQQRKTIQAAIAHACRLGHIQIVQWLADNGGGEQIWGRSADTGQSMLMIACTAGHLHLSQWLLEFGLDIDARDIRQWTPLICACSSGNLALVSWLFDAGAKEDRQSEKTLRHQAEMLTQACSSGNLALVKWLQNRGTFNDKDRVIGVLFATWNTELEIAKWLCDQGVIDFSLFACASLVEYGSEVAWEIGSPTRNLLSVFKVILSAHDYRIMMQATAVNASIRGLLHITQFACGELSHEEFHLHPLYDPWYAAVTSGHTHILEWLLDNFPAIGKTKACQLGQAAIAHEKIVELKMCLAACSVDELDSVRKKIYETACEGGHINVLQWLLQELPCPQDDHPWTPDLCTSMTTACQKGHLAVMKCLVTEGVVDLASDQISELFVVSCSNGHLEIAQWLREEFSLTHEDFRRINEGNNMSVVNIACSRGDLPMAQWMFSIGDILFFKLPERQGTWKAHHGEAVPPILSACLNGHFRLAEWLLLSCGVVPDFLNVKNHHAFHVRLQSDLEFIQHTVALLSTIGVDMLADDVWNFEVLVSGSFSEGYTEIFEWLQTLGKINPRSKNSQGQTLFYLACAKWDLAIVKWLFENGAADDIRIPTPITPMAAACESQDLDTMKWLFENGARSDIHTANEVGMTPMLIACSRDYGSQNLDMVKWLFENGARDDIRKNDNYGNTPMALACSKGHLDIARWLFKAGAQADVRTQNSRGDCPMVEACRNEHLQVAEWLYEHGASNDIKVISQDFSLVRWQINHGSEMAPWLFIHGVAHSSAGDFNKSLLGGRHYKLSRKFISDQMVAVLKDHSNFMSLIFPAINRDFSISTSRLELPVCHLSLLQGHEKTLVQKIVDFAGIPRGRCLKNARDVARSFAVDQVGACTFHLKMAAVRRRRAEEALALAQSAHIDADMKLSQAQKDYAYI